MYGDTRPICLCTCTNKMYTDPYTYNYGVLAPMVKS